MGFFGKKKVNGFETYGEKKTNKKEYLKKILKETGGAIKKTADYIVPPKTKEQIEFEKTLKYETEKARREAYLKSAIKESREKGISMAKAKYNPDVISQKKNKDKEILDALMRL